MRLRRAPFFAALVAVTLTCTNGPAAEPAKTPAQAARPIRPLGVLDHARSYLVLRDYMGFRVYVKKLYWKRMTYGEWYGIKMLINASAQNTGFDLIYIWNLRNQPGKSNLDKTLEYADALMLNGNFEQSFVEYQKMADYLRKVKGYLKSQRGQAAGERYRDAAAIYPFILHSMARALYSGGRYEDALQVYLWLDPSYPRFRQVLFEKMWAAFRAGKVEVALGAIASQRSAYFSRFLSPESYLIQTYIYRKLCRTKDLDQVIREMRAYEESLKKDSGSDDWAGSDLETRVLWSLANSGIPEGAEKLTEVVSSERDREKIEIRSAINRAFQAHRTKILADLKSAMAYAHLAGVTDTSNALRPIQKLTSRDELSKQDLEMWPVDSAEEWMDEVGRHIFVGDSLCSAK